MTDTARWLETYRRQLVRRESVAGVAAAGGVVLLGFAAGALLGSLGVYRAAPWAAFGGWALALAGAAGVWWLARRRTRRLSVAALARHVEEAGGRRRGSIAGLAAWRTGDGSPALARRADERVAGWLEAEGEPALATLRRGALQFALAGGAVLALGITGFVGARPLSGPGAAVWNPVAVVLRARGPVRLDVDRLTVRRGDSVTVGIGAAGRRTATLWVRAPGERWGERPLALDTAGAATVRLGPLESDRFLRATSGGRGSRTLRVRVLLPVLLSAFELTARYPTYLGLPDEHLSPGDEPILMPVGTRIVTRARATAPLAAAQWVSDAGTIATLDTFEGEARGSFAVAGSGTWRLEARTADGGSLDGPAPTLRIVAVPDSTPIVSLPVPGADTVAPLNLRQPLVIDARDDYELTLVEVVTQRVSRLGTRDVARRDTVALPDGGTQRAVLHWTLDLDARGLLPGDTLYVTAQARDNHVPAHVGSSRTLRLRLPSMAELRRAIREAAGRVQEGVDSLARAEQQLVRQLEDLTAERERVRQSVPGTEQRGDDALPFQAAEQARDLLERQEAVAARMEHLREQLRDLAAAAWSAGITDPEFQQRLRELERLLERALTDSLMQRLDQLRRAMNDLDAPDVRDALERLAQEAQRLRGALDRSRELFERAAVEGEMSTLAEDAAELAARQREWNERTEAGGVDSSHAAREDALSGEAEELRTALEQLEARLDSLGQQADIGTARHETGQAAARMRQAAQSARQGDQRGARRAGQAASESLDPVADRLRQERDRLREAWRGEVQRALSGAMVETVQLAKSQQEVSERLRRGDTGAEVRGQQGAVREGVDRVLKQVQGAAGKNALISPQLGAALGAARLHMNDALDQLQRPTPNSREAGQSAGAALDALNATVYALLQTQSDVMGAESGTGLAEAIEQLAELAEQQGGLNAETGGLMTLVPLGGQQLMERLRMLAAEQRALADQLDRIDAQGSVSGMEALAEDARDIARDLESGRLDQATIERQEQLFRRLLDAGRTLRGEEEDPREERQSRTADPTVVAPPPATVRGNLGAPRFPYPTWEELRALSPEERRLILEYFRRLNEREPRGRP